MNNIVKMTAGSLVILMLFIGAIDAQNDDSKDETIQLKSGESLAGKLIKNDEDGVTLDIGGTQLFIRWAYTRGDKHFELRKKATDFQSFQSIVKLADFCHEFALDEEESHVIVAALELEPTDLKLLKRLQALPVVPGLEIPGKEQPKPDPEPEDPKPEAKRPTPTSPFYKVFLECQDSVAKDWIEDHLVDYKYKLGHNRDYFVRIELEVKLILVKNPKFMGAELYAIYDAEVTYKMFKKGEKKAFVEDSFKTNDVRRDTRAEAIRAVRTRVLDSAFPELYDDLEGER